VKVVEFIGENHFPSSPNHSFLEYIDCFWDETWSCEIYAWCGSDQGTKQRIYALKMEMEVARPCGSARSLCVFEASIHQ
jgi:hypothetical protein